MKVAIVGAGNFPISEVRAMLDKLGHEDVVIIEPKDAKEVSLSDIKIPEEIQPSLIKSLYWEKHENLARQEQMDDSYDKYQKKMRNNHYKHMKHRL